MKKVITVLAVFAMVFVLVGCRGNDANICRECGSSCRLVSHTRLTSAHRGATDYYYYSYECIECGYTFTIVNTKQ